MLHKPTMAITVLLKKTSVVGFRVLYVTVIILVLYSRVSLLLIILFKIAIAVEPVQRIIQFQFTDYGIVSGNAVSCTSIKHFTTDYILLKYTHIICIEYYQRIVYKTIVIVLFIIVKQNRNLDFKVLADCV